MKDEVAPLSGSYRNPYGGCAATIVDFLDTLWIMNLKDDFDEVDEAAVTACDKIDFSTTETRNMNVFETIIRYLGGFLAAYELSGERYPSLLSKATEVGELLICAFDTPNRIPVSRWDCRSYANGMLQMAPPATVVAEIGSLPDMWPMMVDTSKTPVDVTGESCTLGGMSDSTPCKYLLKQYLLLGGMLSQPQKLYEGFIDVAKRHLSTVL